MKYKDFKQLNSDEMKGVVGGFANGDVCGKKTCYKWNNANGSMDYGTCSTNTITVNGTTLSSCDCSLSGGTSCDLGM